MEKKKETTTNIPLIQYDPASIPVLDHYQNQKKKKEKKKPFIITPISSLHQTNLKTVPPTKTNQSLLVPSCRSAICCSTICGV